MLPTVAVTFIAYDQNGGPVAGARVQARLDRTEIYQGFVVPEQVEVVADGQGHVILNLWPNVLGVAGSAYRVRAWNPDTGKKFLDALALVPNSPCRLEEILQLEPFPPRDAAQQALIALQAAQADISAQAQATADQARLADDARVGSDTAAVAALTHAQAAALSRLELEGARNDALDAGQQADAGAARAESAAGRAESADQSATEQARIATVKAEAAAEFARATAADRTQTGLDRQAAQASAESFAIHFSQMATSLVETQAIVANHHAFQ